MDDVLSVSLGNNHSAAIKKDGTLWLWGHNNHGQIGDGSTEDRYEPIKIMDGVQSVTFCSDYCAAIKTDGSLWLWGKNFCAEVGDGSTQDRYEPVCIAE